MNTKRLAQHSFGRSLRHNSARFCRNFNSAPSEGKRQTVVLTTGSLVGMGLAALKPTSDIQVVHMSNSFSNQVMRAATQLAMF
mmetsp:Transcript_17030/g.23825  ORF Transcript_17030/g.23825 Transcript_17030/m.23825 type:complete len:83 (-) Transcript_17030:359-607(-)